MSSLIGAVGFFLMVPLMLALGNGYYKRNNERIFLIAGFCSAGFAFLCGLGCIFL
jgi:hypothetical protein